MIHRVARKLNFGKKLLLTAMGMAAVIGPIAMGLVNPASSQAQSQAAPAVSPVFESVSIQPSKATDSLSMTTLVGPGTTEFKATNVTLERLIKYAYNIRDLQISGGPAWVTSAKYDIVGKLTRPVSGAQVRQELQKLLAEQFKLAFHREVKDLPTYELVVGKNGPKLNEVQVQSGAVVQSRRFVGPPGHFVAKQLHVTGLIDVLEESTGLMVFDKTELKGFYDFTLDWTAGSPDSMLAALPNQLGLELNPQTSPVTMFIIDHAEEAKAAE